MFFRLFKYFIYVGVIFVFTMGALPVKANEDGIEYEEIFVSLRVQNVGSLELSPLYVYETGQLLLPVSDVFHFLQFKVDASSGLDSLSGFIGDEEKRYLINNVSKQIQYSGKIYSLKNTELIKTDMDLYLDYTLFGKMFGLFCDFNFRGLWVEMKPAFEVPAIRKIRLEQFRENVGQLRGEVEVDTTLEREYHMLRYGMLDWALSSTQSTSGSSNTRIQLAAGAELFGGETNVSLNYTLDTLFNARSQQYYWKWVNNSAKLARQVKVGRISPSSISSLFDPVVGVSVTNAQTAYRRSFGKYTLSDHTNPGWTVELYINNVIVDYQTADASGFYSFDVPLVYGTSNVKLKFYGPYGEERTEEKAINIPFSFLPAGELEYTLSSGVVLDDEDSRFGRAEIKYGLNRFVTLGGGMEYLSSIENEDKIPFFTLAVAPFSNLLITGEYANGVRTKMIVNYSLSGGTAFELDYTRYVEEQEAISLNYKEERKATLSVPLRFSNFSGYARCVYAQNVYENLSYNTANLTLSSYIGRVNASVNTYANWLKNTSPYVYGNVTLGINLGHGFTFRPRAQADLTNGEIILVKGDLEKRISRSGYLSFSGGKNFDSNYGTASLSFRWDFPFAQVNASASIVDDNFSSTQGAQGSLVFGGGVHADRYVATGTGGLAITPFVDINHNRIKDKGEPFAPGLTVKVSGARVLKARTDSTIFITGLEPYTSHVLTLDDKGLEQVSWQLENKNIRIYIDPNQYKKVDIPVLPMGEADGWVFIEDRKGTRGQGRIVINFFTIDGKFVAKTMSERDGGFTYLGLAPGKYYAQVDAVQMEKLKMISVPGKKYFEIKQTDYGDIVSGFEFVVKRQQQK